MAWNGSTNVGGTTPAPKKPAKKSPGLAHGLIAGAAIILIGVISLYFVTSEPDEQPADKKGPTKIAEVEPDLREDSNITETVKEQKPVKRPFWENPTTNGLNEAQIWKWKWEHRPAPSWTNRSARTAMRDKFEIFDTFIENHIAALITLPPGTMLVGEPEFGKDEESAFLKSCERPIVVNREDDDYTKDLKAAMNETKIALRQRMVDGEDFAEIMRSSHHELQKLGQIRQAIESMAIEAAHNATSQEDISDLFDAANKMLEDKGLAPMEDNPILRQSLRHAIRKCQNN